MFDWISKLFIDEKIEKDKLSEIERQEKERNLLYHQEQMNKPKIVLECEGNYYYKTRESEEHTNYGYRVIHDVIMAYNINVTLEGELESVFISGSMHMGQTRTEKESYEFIIKSMEVGAEPFMKKLQESIVRDYKEHLANNDIKKLREMIKNNKPISVSFTIETTK